ncbi:MAG: PAC2 family protein [Deltaproteobacteria bacterium]|nr:MAG: PAC2 family protein [Deltaproteobacteria bacterium]
MTDVLRIDERPPLSDPTLVLAFEGWNDAGEAATGAARFVAESIGAQPFAEIDPDPFFDFTVRRPAVRNTGGGRRQIDWPRTEFRGGSTQAGRGLVVGLGPEPHLRWRVYADAVSDLVRRLGIRRAVLLGAYLADVLYSRPVGVTGSASRPDLLDGLGVEISQYQGPTGIVGVLAERLRGEGVEVISLWVALPHYIDAAPNPRGALALVGKLGPYLELELDAAPLLEASARFEERVSALVANDPEIAEYVRELKRREFAN